MKVQWPGRRVTLLLLYLVPWLLVVLVDATRVLARQSQLLQKHLGEENQKEEGVFRLMFGHRLINGRSNGRKRVVRGQKKNHFNRRLSGIMYKERTSGKCGDIGSGWGKITSAAACGAGAAALGWDQVGGYTTASTVSEPYYPPGCYYHYNGYADLFKTNESEVVMRFNTQNPNGDCTFIRKCLCTLTCPPGTYQDQSGQSSCKTCASDTYSVAGASSCPFDATSCPTGTFADGSASCKACGAGKYSDQISQTSEANCKECGTGKYTDQTGQVSCKECSTGTYNDQTSQNRCKECGTGKYNDQPSQTRSATGRYNHQDWQTGQASCKYCMAGKYNDQTGQTSIVSCKDCDVGTYNDQNGQSSCKECGTGKNIDETGQNSCKQRTINCAVGSARYSFENSLECFQCPQGQYQDEQSQSNCKVCALGMWSDEQGSNECKWCPDGQWTEYTASTNAEDCEVVEWHPLDIALVSMALVGFLCCVGCVWRFPQSCADLGLRTGKSLLRCSTVCFASGVRQRDGSSSNDTSTTSTSRYRYQQTDEEKTDDTRIDVGVNQFSKAFRTKHEQLKQRVQQLEMEAGQLRRNAALNGVVEVSRVTEAVSATSTSRYPYQKAKEEKIDDTRIDDGVVEVSEVTEVETFLRSVGLGHLLPKFVAENLCTMDKVRLQGVEGLGLSVFHRRKITRALQPSSCSVVQDTEEQHASIQMQSAARSWQARQRVRKTRAVKQRKETLAVAPMETKQKQTPWCEVWEPRYQAYYYYNNATEECVWEKPSGFLSPSGN